MLNENLTAVPIRKKFNALLLAALLILTLGDSFASEEPHIAIQTASLTPSNQAHLLNAKIKYGLTHETIEALYNGITLTFNVDFSVIEDRDWLWNKHLNTTTLRYQIKYHTLAETYQVSDKTNNVHLNFSTLSAALNSLGTLNSIPIHAIKTLRNPAISVSLKAYLNIEALPLPMRPLAYIDSGWHLRSNTFQWPLTR